MNQAFKICRAEEKDIDAMVALSYEKRKYYEQAQPQFWKYATGAEEGQGVWFRELLKNEQYIMLLAANGAAIVGFLIGRLVPAPEVYDPGGLTLMIDDFCVKTPDLWRTVGQELVLNGRRIASAKGASQILIVCGHHDEAKREFLRKMNLSIASEWYVGNIA